MTITVKIKTGNAAMLTREDVAQAIHKAADRFVLRRGESGRILDINGNLCGLWKVG